MSRTSCKKILEGKAAYSVQLKRAPPVGQSLFVLLAEIMPIFVFFVAFLVFFL